MSYIAAYYDYCTAKNELININKNGIFSERKYKHIVEYCGTVIKAGVEASKLVQDLIKSTLEEMINVTDQTMLDQYSKLYQHLISEYFITLIKASAEVHKLVEDLIKLIITGMEKTFDQNMLNQYYKLYQRMLKDCRENSIPLALNLLDFKPRHLYDNAEDIINYNKTAPAA
jgi:hypothetical protein